MMKISKWSEGTKQGLWVLGLLTLINLFNYLDRYILVALSPSIKRDLGLSDTEVGFLTTAFMFTYFLVSPLFGWLGDRKPRYRVMSAGVALWSLATIWSGLARGLPGLLSSRLVVGVGEAAYGSISPSLLSDLYPKSTRGKVFAIFFMAIPVGSALGYLLGGMLEKIVGWRHAFLIAGAPGLLLAIALLFLREPKRGQFDEEEDQKAPKLGMLATYKELASNTTYALTVLGYCAYTFVLGGIAVWIPHYMERYLDVKAADGNMAFGAITVVAGFLGTIIGGAWADRWAKRGTDAYLKLSALSMFVALPVYVLVMEAPSFLSFCVLVFFLEFLLFLSTSPINAQIVNCVSPAMRATANAVGIFMIHLLGDAISPPLVGFISDRSNLRVGMYLFTIAIFISGLIWFWKAIRHWECLSWPSGAFVLPRAQCHRGFHPVGVQENTLAAFRVASQMGAKMIELDVRLSADAVPVVVHDADIQRISGKAGLVGQMKAVDLKQMADIPSLAEVLSDRECSNLIVNVELKSEQAATDGLEAAVATVVKNAGAEKRVLFSCFNPLALRRLSKLLPDVPRALLVSGEKGGKNAFYLRESLLAFLARPHMLNLDQSLYTESFACHLKARKVPVAIWTVDDREKAKKFLAMGAESIISPKPDIL
jgi:MFS family permease